ncbi:hypothetical protein LR48_Vigan07g021400 [Vigna angularis]|uniref:Uncharacterized protein n=1 Tax=Phaseolus angularis TaxID=3914 RepID=A0A0L9UUH6_PHAAN|nr:hypothetical protein LR48_Vigan07g021400 [Vigna angularis]
MILHNPLAPNQLTAHPKAPVQPRIPVQQHPNNPVLPGTLSVQPNLLLPSLRPGLGSLSVRPPIQPTTSTALNQQMHVSLLQNSAHRAPSMSPFL